MLRSKSKSLHELGKINNYNCFISSSQIKIKSQESSEPLAITHVKDFEKHFPDIDLHHVPQWNFNQSLVLI